MVVRMKEDVNILAFMFQARSPSHQLIRGFNIARLLYGFGDASGAGFGSSSWVDCSVGAWQNRSVCYRFGRWGSETDEEKSSNFRELQNLIETLKQMACQGEMSGVEVFLFTDNSMAEAAFNWGSSSNQKLYNMVKQVKLMEMVFLTRIHIIHVAGKRMIAQSTDGLSQGCLADGVMIGKEMTPFIPLQQHTLERSSMLLPWIQSGFGGTQGQILEPLEPEDWYEKGHDIAGGVPNCDGVWVPTYQYGCHVWSPPPCVAEQCLEELQRARHKRQW